MPRLPNPDVRKRLVEAGINLFLHQGFNGTGIQEITSAANIPKGSFYAYFATKDAFGAVVCEEYWSRVMLRLGGIFMDTKHKPLERIAHFFKALTDEKAKESYALGCLLGNLSLELANTSVDVRSKLADIFERWEALIIACLREAETANDLSPGKSLRDIAGSIIESWEGAAMRAKVEQRRRPYRRFEMIVLPEILNV
jgi:TetR/AcrR family transcriptional repressor of nem operon